MEKMTKSTQKHNVDLLSNRSQVANDSRLLICPERFAGSNPAGCARKNDSSNLSHINRAQNSLNLDNC